MNIWNKLKKILEDKLTEQEKEKFWKELFEKDNLAKRLKDYDEAIRSLHDSISKIQVEMIKELEKEKQNPMVNRKAMLKINELREVMYHLSELIYRLEKAKKEMIEDWKYGKD